MTTDTAAEDTYFWVKFFAAVFAIVATCGHRWIAVNAAAWYLSFKRISILLVTDGEFVERQICKTINETFYAAIVATFGAVHAAAWYLPFKRISRLVVTDGKFVKRPTIEEAFYAALNSARFETVLVYGQRGSGKTSFIRSALQGRRGVISISIDKNTADEASKQMTEKLSRAVDFFGNEQSSEFVEAVFKACPIRPVVVVTVEAKCNGEVLEAVLIQCKLCSYNKRNIFQGRTARFVVLSGSRAAIDAPIQLSDLCAVGVKVGHLSESEALLYATARMPKFLKDPLRKIELARTVVDMFDGRVLTLQQVCGPLWGGYPTTDVAILYDRIREEREKEEDQALGGLLDFSHSLSKAPGRRVDADLQAAATLLLSGPQNPNTIIALLSQETDTVPLTPRDLGLFNADAGYHPLAFDPFDTTLSLSGKAIRKVLRKWLQKSQHRKTCR
jgi:hypothetical protein